MKISRKYRFVFVGLQKAGTTSIDDALDPYCNRYYHYYLKFRHERKYHNRPGFKHMYARMARELVGDMEWKNYYSFTFVRNPWDRVLSLYKKHHYYNSTQQATLDKSFNEWIINGANELVRKQLMSDFVSDEKGSVIVNYIGRFETLNEDARKVFEVIGIKGLEPPHLNNSPMGSHYREIYSHESKDLVAQWMAKDIEMFNYEF